MPRVVLLDETMTTVIADPVRDRDVGDVYPGLQLGTVMHPDSIADFPRLAIAHETLPPHPGYGELVQRGPVLKGEDDVWRDTWVVIPADLLELKQNARNRTNEAASEKISTLELALALVQEGIARPRTVLIVNKRNEVLTQIEAATTAAEVEAIMASMEGV